MNQGIFGFPTTISGNIISIAEFDASGTYTIPDDMTSLEILLVGGGGGGGSGGRTVATTATSGGGGGGSGGGMVHHIFYKNDLRYIKNLIITIGLGGNGGASINAEIAAAGTGGPGAAGQAGGFSILRSPNDELSLLAPGGGIGQAGGVLTANSTEIAPRRNFLIMDLPRAMGDAGAMGEINSSGNHNVRYQNFIWSGGAGGGSAQTTTTAISGGSIIFYSNNTNVSLISFGGGLTAAFGGQINLGATLGKGQDGVVLYANGAGSQYFCGFGGAGGGGANTVGGGNGGDGYRGGGGGGGGGVRIASAPVALNAIPSGAGGKGGNGYCRIIARK